MKEGFGAGIKLAWLVTVPFFLLFFFLGKAMIELFMDSQSTVALDTGRVFLKIVSPFYFVIALKLTADGVLRGAGAMRQFMICTFTDLILRVILAFILSVPLGSTGIWLSWPLGWGVGAVMSYGYYRSGCWRGAR